MFTQLNDDGWEFVLAYASQSNNKIEAKYNSYEGECLIIVLTVSSFRWYLYGGPFILVVNHQPLKVFDGIRSTHKIIKWAFVLQEYDFYILHRVGRVN